jgi:hypothetical protein
MVTSPRTGRGGERGSASIELLGSLPYLILAALLAWQLLLVATTLTAAQNAARNGSRAASLGDNPITAATGSLPDWLADDATAQSPPGSNRVTVTVPVPIVAPGFTSDQLVVRRSAHLP